MLLPLLLSGCDGDPWNNPYPFEDPYANTLYFAFTSRPNHLDPAQSYTVPESTFIYQIYEPPYQYHYLKRPFVLEPLTAAAMPEIKYFDHKGIEISDGDSSQIAFTEYRIQIKPGIYYQPHPAFAKKADGNYYYHHLSESQANQYKRLSDFKETGTKELVAEDYVYEIKRLAEPRLSSPIFGVMSNHIVGLAELRKRLNQIRSDHELDLRGFELEGVQVIDRYTYRIRIHGHYPQFRFWLAMAFFAPVPWEVATFYAQKGLEKHNISLDWYPVGTGPYEMNENDPNRRITLVRNPNFRVEFYPTEGSPEDESVGLLNAKGSQIPSVDKVIFTLEKEDIPYWNKFLQGYYDFSGISSDNFTTAVQFTPRGAPAITEQLKEQNIRLNTSVTPGLWYWGFNMLDETVGGNSERNRVLRQAIAQTLDVQYFIDIFMNGRGIRARGPIPPDIFGFEAQTPVKEVSMETAVQAAKLKLKNAGFKEGMTLYLDAAMTGGPEEIAIHTWLVQQFQRLGFHLIIRGTDFNRYQQKIRMGTAQIFFSGWSADYPDPENFLFLFYSKNGSAQFSGENSTNYHNPAYDLLFDQMRSMPDGPARFELIQKMVNILNVDTPGVFGFYPKSYALYHEWMRISKPSGIINNTLKYAKINPDIRAHSRLLWNKPIVWPLVLIVIMILVMILWIFIRYSHQERKIRGRI